MKITEKFINIINKAFLIEEHNGKPEELNEVLKEMIRYAREHFRTEETYMIKFNYPEYQYHKEEHHDFSTKTIAYVNGLINADYKIASEILEYLKKWLVNHIQETDKKYVNCFKNNGLM